MYLTGPYSSIPSLVVALDNGSVLVNLELYISPITDYLISFLVSLQLSSGKAALNAGASAERTEKPSGLLLSPASVIIMFGLLRICLNYLIFVVFKSSYF